MFKVLRKADIILIAFLIIAGLAATFFFSSGKEIDASNVTVTIDGEETARYSLATDREIDLGTGNVIVIEDKTVRMKSATCHGHDCIHQGRIEKTGETITCLPHKVIIEVVGGDGYDTISQ